MTAAPWWMQRLCAFDTETTGVDVFADRIVQAAIIHCGGGQPTKRRVWLINPGIPIPAGASAIHGITDALVVAAMPPKKALVEIADELAIAVAAGEALAICNAPFDLTILGAELQRHDLELPIGPAMVVDPLVLDKQVDPFRKGSRKLSALAEHYRAMLDQAHDAAPDALAAARVAYRIASLYPEIGNATLQALQALQARWYADQAASLEAYFRKKNPNAVCPREWPLRRAA